jgi:hypothetical protein
MARMLLDYVSLEHQPQPEEAEEAEGEERQQEGPAEAGEGREGGALPPFEAPQPKRRLRQQPAREDASLLAWVWRALGVGGGGQVPAESPASSRGGSSRPGDSSRAASSSSNSSVSASAVPGLALLLPLSTWQLPTSLAALQRRRLAGGAGAWGPPGHPGAGQSPVTAPLLGMHMHMIPEASDYWSFGEVAEAARVERQLRQAAEAPPGHSPQLQPHLRSGGGAPRRRHRRRAAGGGGGVDGGCGGGGHRRQIALLRRWLQSSVGSALALGGGGGGGEEAAAYAVLPLPEVDQQQQPWVCAPSEGDAATPGAFARMAGAAAQVVMPGGGGGDGGGAPAGASHHTQTAPSSRESAGGALVRWQVPSTAAAGRGGGGGGGGANGSLTLLASAALPCSAFRVWVHLAPAQAPAQGHHHAHHQHMQACAAAWAARGVRLPLGGGAGGLRQEAAGAAAGGGAAPAAEVDEAGRAVVEVTGLVAELPSVDPLGLQEVGALAGVRPCRPDGWLGGLSPSHAPPLWLGTIASPPRGALPRSAGPPRTPVDGRPQGPQLRPGGGVGPAPGRRPAGLCGGSERLDRGSR